VLLEALDYRIFVSTPSEILKALLAVANTSADFSEIIAGSNEGVLGLYFGNIGF